MPDYNNLVVCTTCHGSGRVEGKICTTCKGLCIMMKPLDETPFTGDRNLSPSLRKFSNPKKAGFDKTDHVGNN